ncbi:MAG: alanine dehydrogenase [Bacillales bacterium]|jgi:alanine dehydrogenase|nr:alanine dehydrogenase [Bacillales bacterium]
MKIGTVKEIKNNENRVGLTPQAVHDYVLHGHQVYVESNAGVGSGFINEEYRASGATIISDASTVWNTVDMMVKVKEPLPVEYKYFRKGLILYTYLHLAAEERLLEALLKSEVTSVAYETIELEDRSLPCLKPMSQVAGRLAVIEGSKYLQTPYGGRGILINGVPGVSRANAVVIGAGTVGENAISSLVGLGANVTVLDVNLYKLEQLNQEYKNQITTLYSNTTNIISALVNADLVISCVLLPGAKAPKLIKTEYYKDMKLGAVIVDVAIDQGGSTEVSKPTTHSDPVFTVDGIIHYCVANMPGAVALTSTLALNNATIKFGLQIADKGIEKALEYKPITLGLNTYQGKITNGAVKESYKG